MPANSCISLVHQYYIYIYRNSSKTTPAKIREWTGANACGSIIQSNKSFCTGTVSACRPIKRVALNRPLCFNQSDKSFFTEAVSCRPIKHVVLNRSPFIQSTNQINFVQTQSVGQSNKSFWTGSCVSTNQTSRLVQTRCLSTSQTSCSEQISVYQPVK